MTILPGAVRFRARIPLPSVGKRSALRAAATLVLGAALAASGATLVRADLFDWLGLRSRPQPSFETYRYPVQTRRARVSEPVADAGVTVRKRRRHVAETSVRRKSRAAFASVGAGIRARQNMCVRTCDGYAFPVSGAGRHSVEALEGACHAACPGAETALYTMPSGGIGDPAGARSVRDGTLYGRLKTALLYRQSRVASCSCQGPDNIASRVPILDDPTLRHGDVVVDPKGDAKVFGGDGQLPHSPRAFADYRGSRALGRTGRAQVDRLIGTSQREAAAQAFERTMKSRQAAAGIVTAMREVAAPAGSMVGVRVYQASVGEGALAQSGARIIVVR